MDTSERRVCANIQSPPMPLSAATHQILFYTNDPMRRLSSDVEHHAQLLEAIYDGNVRGAEKQLDAGGKPA